MEKTIILNNQIIEYTLKISKRSRSMKISIYQDGDIVVTIPYRIQRFMGSSALTLFVEKFIMSKSAWILEKIELSTVCGQLKLSEKDRAGDASDYGGNENVNSGSNHNNVNSEGGAIYIRKSKAQRKAEKKAEYQKYKNQALILAEAKIAQFNKSYNFKINRISIKNQKTRWGSCSGKGNLNFNYKIALIPEKLAEYIVVHEICHLGELNHSKRFWDLVAKTIPEHKANRKELRKNGAVFQ